MKISRRDVVKSGAGLLGTGVLGLTLGAQPVQFDSNSIVISTDFDIQDPAIREIASACIDTAISRGAKYCDVRMTFTKYLGVGAYAAPGLSETMELGVRALVDGYWGFASSPIWSREEAGRLGAAAYDQATANLIDGPRQIAFRSAAEESIGHWVMPVEQDPFRLNFNEVYDAINGIHQFISRLKHILDTNRKTVFQKQYRGFFSSDGHRQTQVLNRTFASLVLAFNNRETGDTGGFSVDSYRSSPGGLETLRDRPIREDIQKEYDEMIETWKLPMKPAEIGRFDAIVDQNGMAKLTSCSIGFATELDRALGFEANASGTSYIVDPASMLGTFVIGSSKINISANRSDLDGIATVAWDDEGVKPRRSQLIKNGILNEMQTTRELLDIDVNGDYSKEKYGELQGYSVSPTGIFAPVNYTPNLHLEGDASGPVSMNELRSGLDKGMELKQPHISLDYQQSTGFASGTAYEIKGGKRVSRLMNAGILFRSSEIWNNVVDLGGKETEMCISLNQKKGEPEGEAHHTVRAVPARIKDLTFIDITRKA